MGQLRPIVLSCGMGLSVMNVDRDLLLEAVSMYAPSDCMALVSHDPQLDVATFQSVSGYGSGTETAIVAWLNVTLTSPFDRQVFPNNTIPLAKGRRLFVSVSG